MQKLVACLLGLLPLLAACGLFDKEPTMVMPPGISYRTDDKNAAAKAQEYCGQYGMKAKQESTTKASDSTIVTYSCS